MRLLAFAGVCLHLLANGGGRVVARPFVGPIINPILKYLPVTASDSSNRRVNFFIYFFRLSRSLVFFFVVSLSSCSLVSTGGQERDESVITMAAVEKERDFYFDKLRDIELLFQVIKHIPGIPYRPSPSYPITPPMRQKLGISKCSPGLEDVPITPVMRRKSGIWNFPCARICIPYLLHNHASCLMTSGVSSALFADETIIIRAGSRKI